MFGFSRAEAVGQHWTFLVPAAIHGQSDGVWDAIVKRRGGSRSTNQNLTRSGQPIDCEWFNTPLIDPNRRTIGVASLVMNVTGRKRAEEALKQKVEFSPEFTVYRRNPTLSHRVPLTSPRQIHNFSESQ